MVPRRPLPLRRSKILIRKWLSITCTETDRDLARLLQFTYPYWDDLRSDTPCSLPCLWSEIMALEEFSYGWYGMTWNWWMYDGILTGGNNGMHVMVHAVWGRGMGWILTGPFHFMCLFLTCICCLWSFLFGAAVQYMQGRFFTYAHGFPWLVILLSSCALLHWRYQRMWTQFVLLVFAQFFLTKAPLPFLTR